MVKKTQNRTRRRGSKRTRKTRKYLKKKIRGGTLEECQKELADTKRQLQESEDKCLETLAKSFVASSITEIDNLTNAYKVEITKLKEYIESIETQLTASQDDAVQGVLAQSKALREAVAPFLIRKTLGTEESSPGGGSPPPVLPPDSPYSPFKDSPEVAAAEAILAQLINQPSLVSSAEVAAGGRRLSMERAPMRRLDYGTEGGGGGNSGDEDVAADGD